MKNKHYISGRKLLSTCLIVCLLSIHFLVEAQYCTFNSGSQTPLYWGTNGRLGVGFSYPTAKFHIRDNSGLSLSTAVYRAALFPSSDGDSIGTVEHLKIMDGKLYGIYQTSNTTYGVMNYFKDNLQIGTNLIWTYNSVQSGIETSSNSFAFSVARPSSSEAPYQHSFTQILYPDSVLVSNKLSTKYLRLSTNPTLGYILTSDGSGNASWTSPAILNDEDWLPSGIAGEDDGSGKIPLQNLILSSKFQFVGIGTSTPGSQLAVNGKITAKEVEVTLDGFPDSVFSNSYHLREIRDIEEYVKTNKHLPDVPSENEVKRNGLELGKMNAILLQKVEELTLYIISMKKEIEQLKSEQTVKH